MRALTCPKCGAPLQHEMTACPYCRVGLVNEASPVQPAGSTNSAGGSNPAGSAPPPAPTPPGWVVFSDLWNGFTVAHPPGWEVVTLAGQTSVRLDPAGITSAGIAPFTFPSPAPAQQVAALFINLASRSLQNFQAWRQGNAAPDTNRVTIRVRGGRFGQPVEGIYNILVEGVNCVISGYMAPVQQMAQLGPVMAQILATFRTGERMPRQVVRDPMENAFTIQVPQGWGWRGGINRNNIGGSGTVQFNAARDPQGLVSASIPNYSWVYTDPSMSFFMFPTGYPSSRYMPAAQFGQQVVVQQMRQFHPDLKVEAITERPDLAEISQTELAQAGYPPGMFQTSSAIIDVTYTENGQRLREKSRVATMRQNGQPMWNALMDVMYRAPVAEFTALEPVLLGCLVSIQMNPQWKAGEQQLAQNFIANSQADIRRRQGEISRTLSETSDLISSSYWSRQETYDRISEMRSNATLGVQNVVNDSGDVYKVPYGYDRYWQDGLGNLYGGSWLSQPDINWQPLTPTGI